MHHRITFSSPRAPPLHCCATKIELIKLPQRRMPCLHRCVLSSLKSQTEESYTAAQASFIPPRRHKTTNHRSITACMHLKYGQNALSHPCLLLLTFLPGMLCQVRYCTPMDHVAKGKKACNARRRWFTEAQTNSNIYQGTWHVYIDSLYTSTRSTLVVRALPKPARLFAKRVIYPLHSGRCQMPNSFATVESPTLR